MNRSHLKLFFAAFFVLQPIFNAAGVYAQDNILKIKGEVIGELEKPLPAATIVLLDKDDRNAVKTTADSNGYFYIAHQVKGTYTLLVTYTGYQSYRSPRFELSNTDLGKIRLLASTGGLEEVVVESKQS